jgi:hypothetical protein
VRSWVLAAFVISAVASRAHADDKVPVWLGIQYSQGGAMGIPVTHVFDGTAAAEAGVRAGDEILEFGGVRTQPGAQLAPMISALDVGARVKMKVLRAGKVVALEAVMLPRADSELIAKRLVGKPAPELSIAVPQQGHGEDIVDLATLHKKVAILAFFPDSCDGCASIVSALGPWAEHHARDPVVVLGAMPTPALDGLRSFLARNPILVPVGGIPPVNDGEHESPFFADPNVPAVTFIVIDGDGVVEMATIVAAGADVDHGALDDVEVSAERALKHLDRR